MKKILHFALPIALIFFALTTLFVSSSVLFDWFGIREMEGRYVTFVVWANWFCSWMYLIAAAAFFRRRSVAVKWLMAAAALLLMAFIGLALHIYAGGAYETKTLGALGFRFAITVIFAWVFHASLRKGKTRTPLS